MVVDAANSNGPFQPVALLHIRGEWSGLLPWGVNKWLLCFGSELQEVLADSPDLLLCCKEPGCVKAAWRFTNYLQNLRLERGLAWFKAGFSAFCSPSHPPFGAVLMSKDVKSLLGKAPGGRERRARRPAGPSGLFAEFVLRLCRLILQGVCGDHISGSKMNCRQKCAESVRSELALQGTHFVPARSREEMRLCFEIPKPRMNPNL